MTEEEYKNMSVVDRFELLKDYYNYMDKTTNQGQINTATASRIKQPNVVTLTEGAGSNFSTTVIAENKNENMSEIAGEPIWNRFGYFGQLCSDFNLEKVNFPENALFYVNQVYLTVKLRDVLHNRFFYLLQIIIRRCLKF